MRFNDIAHFFEQSSAHAVKTALLMLIPPGASHTSTWRFVIPGSPQRQPAPSAARAAAPPASLKILTCGAGVIGSLYAAKLQRAGHRVTVLARGMRLAEIRSHGLVLEELGTGERTATQVETIERLNPADNYDLALITVRRDQLAGLMADLAANRCIPTLLFMLNNPSGAGALTLALGRDRILLGFPGAGGVRAGHVVRYAMIAQQPTTLGEIDGQRSARLRLVSTTFQASGFPTVISAHMEAWLKTHAFFITSVCGAIYRAGGDCRGLSEDAPLLRLMVRGVREGFMAVRALGQEVTPLALSVLFEWLPEICAVTYWRRFFQSKNAEHVFGAHARAAAGEIRDLAQDCRAVLKESGVEAPALRELYEAIDAYALGARKL
jgi:2-dehydropantoate 2-reductase